MKSIKFKKVAKQIDSILAELNKLNFEIMLDRTSYENKLWECRLYNKDLLKEDWELHSDKYLMKYDFLKNIYSFRPFELMKELNIPKDVVDLFYSYVNLTGILEEI